jgi:hypothetical protein
VDGGSGEVEEMKFPIRKEGQATSDREYADLHQTAQQVESSIAVYLYVNILLLAFQLLSTLY